MKSMLDLIVENRKEAVSLLSNAEEKTIELMVWNKETEEYEPTDNGTDDCYIRYCDNDGNIIPLLVVAIRLNEKGGNQRIEILTTESVYTVSDGTWFPADWADDISDWYVYEVIGDYFGQE